MRGKAQEQRTLLMVGSMEQRIPQSHPIRRVKALADGALGGLGDVFEEMYAEGDGPRFHPSGC